jgi:bisphosphoglycerate-independent phosphoglycerate mutase (AlkP superfamily)
LDSTWDNQWMASYDCGVNGPFTGYRDDSITFNRTLNILNLHHPDLMLVNFKDPDAFGHANNWPAYLNAIIQGDSYVKQIWNFIESDPYYAGTTTLFVTNDHGRHDDGHLDGFVSHGDNCEGCKHIMLLAMGPDIKENYSTDESYVLCDIAKTTSTLMSFPMNTGTGRVMTKILK